MQLCFLKKINKSSDKDDDTDVTVMTPYNCKQTICTPSKGNKRDKIRKRPAANKDMFTLWNLSLF